MRIAYVPAKSQRIRKEKKKIAELQIAAEPAEAAEEAGLRYVSDDQPGYTRKRNGDGFVYFDTEGKPIRDEQRILRINRLAIPPAYRDVWICPSPNGHLQATGKDDRGRKQYRYHERWREVRDENKYEKMLIFGEKLGKIRRRVKKDMALRGLPREKVLATVVHLLETTFIRVGNEEYARENKSFGLTTMRNRHVEVKGSTVTFNFRGKSGIMHEREVEDPRVAKVIRKLTDLPGQELFQYVGDEGEARNVSSQDVNDYLKEISGEEFTAKDFRTWAGTVMAAVALNEVGAFENKTQAKKNVRDAVHAVAKVLGNTPAVCRKCYVHPLVLETYLSGAAIEGLKKRAEETLVESLEDLSSAEAAVLTFLREKLAKKK
jgi:DNA topoisomerase I